jgi:hypothetical protein
MDIKILKYELKRIIFSKMFVITFIIALLFSVINLYTIIIQGISGTAPFSQWSYCTFLCDINTIILFILMLSCTGLFSRNEQSVREITSCTSLPPKKYGYKNFSFVYFLLNYCGMLHFDKFGILQDNV